MEESALKDALHQKGLSRAQKVLICLGVAPGGPRSIADLKKLAAKGGLPEAKKWNLSALLAGQKGFAVRTDAGWELNAAGRAEVQRVLSDAAASVTASKLRSLLPTIGSGDTRAFVEEAVHCVEHGLYRAGVVLSWLGALALLYDEVVASHLAAFNAEAARRDPRWRSAKTSDDLARMKEHDFLQVLEAISVIGKSVKAELEACLKLRNGCGHPNSLKLAEHRVNSHVETLVMNVFSRP
jgi:hypothetical protein